MPVDYLSSILPTLLLILVTVFGAFLAYIRLAPTLSLNIIPSWIDGRLLHIRLELKNTSRVRVKKKRAVFQFLRYDLEKMEKSLRRGSLSEWVPLTQGRDEGFPKQDPIEWRDPLQVFSTTEWLDSGEKITIDRLEYCEGDGVAFKILLQATAELTWVQRRGANVWRRGTLAGKKTLDWTTTRIVVRTPVK
jgi:hypothetical protein